MLQLDRHSGGAAGIHPPAISELHVIAIPTRDRGYIIGPRFHELPDTRVGGAEIDQGRGIVGGYQAVRLDALNRSFCAAGAKILIADVN